MKPNKIIKNKLNLQSSGNSNENSSDNDDNEIECKLEENSDREVEEKANKRSRNTIESSTDSELYTKKSITSKTNVNGQSASNDGYKKCKKDNKSIQYI